MSALDNDCVGTDMPRAGMADISHVPCWLATSEFRRAEEHAREALIASCEREEREAQDELAAEWRRLLEEGDDE